MPRKVGLTSEILAAVAVALELLGISPTHELIRYAICKPGDELDEEGARKLQDELIVRFWDREEDWHKASKTEVLAHVYHRYAAALRDAVVFEREARTTAFLKLGERRMASAGIKHKNNSELPAGSPMYFYCRLCGVEIVVPEDYREGTPTHCDECKTLIENGWLQPEIRSVPSR